MSDYKKAKITVSFHVNLDMDNYPNGLTNLQDAVAYDLQLGFDVIEVIELYLSLSDEDTIAIVNVEDAPVEKNEVALLAERMSKEL